MNFLLKVTAAAIALVASISLTAQTAGTLTVTFTEATPSSTYQSQGKHALAAWIQTSAGGFVKTKLRYAGPGGGTEDHLPTFAVNSGGIASNCLSASCNITGATATGATLTSFTTRTFTWNGTNVSNAVVADGTYKVTLQSTWNHGTTGTNTTSYTFTKGPNNDHQTPANNAVFTNVVIDWVPSTTVGINEFSENQTINIYPNPSIDGLINVDFEKANNIKVVNTLGVAVLNENIDQTAVTKALDLTTLSNGIYFVYIFDGENAIKRKIIINK